MENRRIKKLRELLRSMDKKQVLLFCICGLLILLNSVAIVKELPIVPLITCGVVFVYLIIFHLDWVIYLMALCTPFSVIISSQNIHLGLSLPSEIIMIALTLLFLFRVLYDVHIDKKLLTHPISVAIYAYLLWMLLTCITSSDVVVSLKFWTSKLWFIIAGYWIILQFIQDDTGKAVRYFNCYAIGLAVVVIITSIKHAMSGFDEHYAHWVMSPYYNDHTAYGAVLAFFLPISAGCFFLPGNNLRQKIFYAILTGIFLMGLYLSFSRAAWLSIMLAVGIYMVLRLRIKLSWLIVGISIVGSTLFFYADDILYKMSRNSQESSGQLAEHLQSMSNISTDASNVERLNRWNAAFSMIKERPLFGWGPGTYQFVYAPFQKSRYKTIISTNFGDGGNAHSEYLGPCAETGIPGLLTVIGLLFCSLYSGLKTYNGSSDPTRRLLALMMTLALFTYFSHGFLNNFLDTDKLSVPFWGAFAVLAITNIQMRTERRVIQR